MPKCGHFLHYICVDIFDFIEGDVFTKGIRHTRSGVSYSGDPLWPSGYDAWLPSVCSQIRVSAGSPSGLAWSLYKCAAWWKAVCGPRATER